MNKKTVLSLLLVLSISSQAKAGFWDAVAEILAAMTSEIEVRKCAGCGAESKHSNRLLSLPCDHIICESCKRAKIDNALKGNRSPVCDCGRTFGFNASEQRDAYNAATRPAPSERPAPVVSKCASGCGDVVQKKFSCGHGMCKSCLRSRVSKETKEAGGGYLYATCPKCGNMLMDDNLTNLD